MSRSNANAKRSAWFDKARERMAAQPSEVSEVRKGYIVCKRCEAQVYQAQEVAGMCRPCAAKTLNEWERVGDLLAHNNRIADALGPLLTRRLLILLGENKEGA